MGRGNSEDSYVDYYNKYNDENNEPGSSEYHFGRMVFYGKRAENETKIWSSGVRMSLEETPTTSPSPPVLEDIVANVAKAAFDLTATTTTTALSKGHRHHHHIHLGSESSFSLINSGGGIKATRRLINTASSMAAGVIDSATTSSFPSPQQYYEADATAGIYPTIVSTNGDSSDQMSEMTTMSNDTSNSSIFFQDTWPVRDPLYITIPITVIYIIILLIGLLGNVVTCIVIVRSRYLHTTTNYYLFSLAISDLLLLLSGLPVEMYSIWKRYPYIFGEYFCIGRGLAAETSSNATVLTITAFTIERYLAICRPFMIQKWQNKLSRVVRQILIIWVISISLAIPQVCKQIITLFQTYIYTIPLFTMYYNMALCKYVCILCLHYFPTLYHEKLTNTLICIPFTVPIINIDPF